MVRRCVLSFFFREVSAKSVFYLQGVLTRFQQGEGKYFVFHSKQRFDFFLFGTVTAISLLLILKSVYEVEFFLQKSEGTIRALF